MTGPRANFLLVQCAETATRTLNNARRSVKIIIIMQQNMIMQRAEY